MSAKYLIDSATYLAHESGTKFYEVVNISCVDQNIFLSINRWGKMSAADAGGEIKITGYRSTRLATAAAESTLDGKFNRGYSRDFTVLGLHGMGQSFDAVGLAMALNKHYGVKNAGKIATALGMAANIKPEDRAWVDEADEINEIVDEKPAPEPTRDASWGSW